MSFIPAKNENLCYKDRSMVHFLTTVPRRSLIPQPDDTAQRLVAHSPLIVEVPGTQAALIIASVMVQILQIWNITCQLLNWDYTQ